MIYAVYLAYHKNDVLCSDIEGFKNLPEYPPSIARLRAYHNQSDQMECYANTMCPASMLIEAIDEKDLETKVKEMQQNFLNLEWLGTHIKPYI